MTDRPDLFECICKNMVDTYRRKNNDYGDSFSKIRDKYPTAILIRLNDKLSRVESLLGGKQQMVKDESIDDTFLDMAVYCIMELVERKLDKEALKVFQETFKVKHDSNIGKCEVIDGWVHQGTPDMIAKFDSSIGKGIPAPNNKKGDDA